MRRVLGALLAVVIVTQAYAQSTLQNTGFQGGQSPGSSTGNAAGSPATSTVLQDQFGNKAAVWPNGSVLVRTHINDKCSPAHLLTAANTNPAWFGGHELCGALIITNTGSTTAGDLRFYDTARAPACGTDHVVLNIAIPVNSTAANVAGISVPLPDGLYFASGVGVCVTGAISDTDTTAFTTGAQINFGVR